MCERNRRRRGRVGTIDHRREAAWSCTVAVQFLPSRFSATCGPVNGAKQGSSIAARATDELCSFSPSALHAWHFCRSSHHSPLLGHLIDRIQPFMFDLAHRHMEHQRRSLHPPGRAGEALYPVPSLPLVWNLALVGKHLRRACIAIANVELQIT